MFGQELKGLDVSDPARSPQWYRHAKSGILELLIELLLGDKVEEDIAAPSSGLCDGAALILKMQIGFEAARSLEGECEIVPLKQFGPERCASRIPRMPG